ncbi:putative methylthioadenosine nucleosidase [Helianthus anomalus]
MLQLHCSTLPSRFISFFKYFRYPLGVPWIRYHGYYEDLHINVVYPGKDRDLGINSVGTVPASLVTYASIQALKPDLLINAGTAGGFKGPDKYGLG